MISSLKSTLSRNITNARGWRTNRKIVVIESDDWGGIRMPGKDAYSKLQKSKIGKSLSLFDSLDSLERRDDFQNMLELANEFKDYKGNPLIITLNTVMQNPNFKKIEDSGYNQFYGVPFLKSYQEYYGEDLKDLWSKGMKEKLIRPQFHAREHVNEFLWLKDLREGNNETRIAFDRHFFGLKTKTSSTLRQHYLAAFFSETEEEFESVKSNTIDGLNMFKNVFDFSSKSFIACNYVWPKELEVVLKENDVLGIQSQKGNINTDFTNSITSVKRFYTGQKNELNQKYSVRNVTFEPYSNPEKDWIAFAMKEIENAFFWKTPAIISMHRINFVSEMSVENRDENLVLLKNLIKTILEKHPEVEFMSSDELFNLLSYETSYS